MRSLRVLAVILILVSFREPAFGQFGAMLSGVGPINQSMGGASTAAPLDTLGALYWNPATISALPNSTDFGLELLIPHSSIASTVNANALGPGVPPVTLSGYNHSSSGTFPLPEFGIVYTPEDSNLTYGLGVLTVAGFGVNYPGGTQNPILFPPSANGVGALYSQYQLMQVVPTLSIQLTEGLSFGIGPVIDLAGLSVDPGFLTAPDNSAGGAFTYPALTHGQFQWGAGFQLGAYYVTDGNWQFGASFKSQQWFRDFTYNAQNQVGLPEDVRVPFNAPMIVSLGTAYTGFDRILVSADARYLDFSNTVGYAKSGYNPDGSIAGLGWKNVYAISTGLQYLLTDFLALRLGYSFNTNPIEADKTFFNIASPLVIQHTVNFGGTYNLAPNFRISLTYTHMFENSISGPIVTGAGAIPGTNITSTASADAITVGASIAF